MRPRLPYELNNVWTSGETRVRLETIGFLCSGKTSQLGIINLQLRHCGSPPSSPIKIWLQIPVIRLLRHSSPSYGILNIFITFSFLFYNQSLDWKNQNFADFVSWGREPPEAMSLRYADASHPDLLGRQGLWYAEMSMRNTSKCACVIQVLNKRFFTIF